MLSKLFSVTLEGIDGHLCEVEVDVSRRGFDKPTIVGLPDAAVKESIDRVYSAIDNSGFTPPHTAPLINLAPADIKKEGPAFDLPIALGMLACNGVFSPEALGDYVIAGELALDGRVRPVYGVINLAILCKKLGLHGVVVPVENAKLMKPVQGLARAKTSR